MQGEKKEKKNFLFLVSSKSFGVLREENEAISENEIVLIASLILSGIENPRVSIV